jgi:hypothetical protein
MTVTADLGQLNDSTRAGEKELSVRLNQFSSPQVRDQRARERELQSVAQALSQWLANLGGAVAAVDEYLDARSGRQLQRLEADDLLKNLQSFRAYLNTHVLSPESTFAKHWPADYRNLRGEADELTRRWEDAIDAVNPYCELLSFRDTHPGLGLEDLSRAREHNRELQQDSRQIIRRFHDYRQVVLALTGAVAERLQPAGDPG